MYWKKTDIYPVYHMSLQYKMCRKYKYLQNMYNYMLLYWTYLVKHVLIY